MSRPRRRPSPRRPLPLSAWTERDRQIIDAFFATGSFKAAAEDIGCNQETVSAVWHRWRVSLRDVLPRVHAGQSRENGPAGTAGQTTFPK